jgi:predicted nucleic acid-binding protein
MQGRLPLVNKDRKVWDVNILAIFLVEDHPGNKYISPIVEEGLKGAYTPILLDILPIRAYWIMEKRWECDKVESAQAIIDFLRKYERPVYVQLKKETIMRSFELANKLKHDVYDCVYLALAFQENASSIITTDTDFERLCREVGLKYVNPVPEKILTKFK